MNNILLNFQSSYSGGGLKRLIEFSKYFNDTGGATFVVHPYAVRYLSGYDKNVYVVVQISVFDRLINRCSFESHPSLRSVEWDVYYSYGVPVYKSILANKKIMHVSNVLPFVWGRYGYGFLDWLKFKLISFYIIKSFPHCTHVSAESKYSLALLRKWHGCDEILSQNGSDEELSFDPSAFLLKNKSAIVLGTHIHKDLISSLAVFDFLLCSNPGMKLYVIGAEKSIPDSLRKRSDVVILGVKDRLFISKLLMSSYYYISTTRIENSFNAASEGVFLAEESYISKIPPHLELLNGFKYTEIKIKGCEELLLKISRGDVKSTNLKSWREIAKSTFFLN